MESVFKDLQFGKIRPDPPMGQQQQAAIRAVSSEHFATIEDTASEGQVLQ